jgi:molybdopterin-guanine dinucleotide biosynthesis protein A
MTPLVAVLAGGRGRRAGGAKPGLLLAGRPLIAWPLAAARAAGLDSVVVAKRSSPLPELDAEVWIEPEEPVHPLAGIVCALERAGRDVIALGCDMPFVTATALRALGHAPAGPEPLLARYAPAHLPVLRAALAREAPLREAFAALEPAAAAIEPACLRNVNTPGELRAAAAELQNRA